MSVGRESSHARFDQNKKTFATLYIRGGRVLGGDPGNDNGLKAIHSILASCEWTDDVTLCCKKDSVPGCLGALRTWFNVKETPAAKAVTIHAAPLENRTYL